MGFCGLLSFRNIFFLGLKENLNFFGKFYEEARECEKNGACEAIFGRVGESHGSECGGSFQLPLGASPSEPQRRTTGTRRCFRLSLV